MDASFGARSTSSYDWETLFDAYRFDPETSLYHVRFRYLHPNLGRWLTRDPIGEPLFEARANLLLLTETSARRRLKSLVGGPNTYWFVGNAPIGWTDIFGLQPKGGERLMQLACESRRKRKGIPPKDVLCKLWNLPNTLVGLMLGGVGAALGADVTVGNNALQFEGHPCMAWGDITLGNTICYNKDAGPAVALWPGCPYTYGDHERQHTYQGEILGPLYLPANILGGCFSLLTSGNWHDRNFMERGPCRPDSAQNIIGPPAPPQPWP
jgi:RHS repeat-associated protein